MELSLGLFFLTIVSLATVSVECRNLKEQNGAPRTSHSCPCSKKKHAHSKTDGPESSTGTQDLPNEFFRQSNPSRTISQQVTDFLDGERCGCGCRKHIRGTSTSGNVATATEAASDPTTDLPTTKDMATFDEEDNAITNDNSPTTTDMTTFDEQDSTIINDSIPTTTELSQAYKYNTTCTTLDCLTNATTPNEADVMLRYRCMPPRKCNFLAPSSNNNEEEKVNEDDKLTHSDKISGGERGTSHQSTDGKTHGSSSNSLASHHTQSSSGYSLLGRHPQSTSSYIIGENHTYGSSHSTTGDHTYSAYSHSTTEDLTHSSSSHTTIGDHIYSSMSHNNKGHGSKVSYQPKPDTPSSDSSSTGSNDSQPIHATVKPGNGGASKPTFAGMGSVSKLTYAEAVMGGGGMGSGPNRGGADPSYGGIGSGARPITGEFTTTVVPVTLNYPEPVPTTQRITTAKMGSPVKEQNSFPKKIPTPPNCGVFKPTLFNRIKGGTPTTVGKWPWLVAYGYGYAGDGPQQVSWLCAGALITAKSSITAAHCLEHPSRKLMLARFGDLDLDDDEDGANHVTAEVLNGIKHPLFNKREFDHDIAIVVLKQTVTFTSTIKPICLPLGEDMINEDFNGMEPYIAGWGNLEFRGGDNSLLNEAQIPVVSNEECAKTYAEKLKRVIQNSHICAGGNGTDTCQGDSGGPLMVPWNQHFYAIGLVSWGFRCGAIGYPGVYTRITSYLDWLQLNLT